MLLTAEWLLPVTADPVRRGAVAVEGDRILACGSLEAMQQRFPDHDIRDFGQAVLMPGFVDIHSHLDYSAMRGALDPYPFFAWIVVLTRLRLTLSFDDMLASARWGAIESIRSGITTTCDAGETGASLRAMSESGLRGIFYQEVFGWRPEEIAPAMATLENRLTGFAETKSDLVQLGISPHAPYTVSADLFHRAGELGKREGYPLCIHIAESPAEDQLMANATGPIADFVRSTGAPWTAIHTRPVKYLADIGVLDYQPLLAHCVHATEEDISLIASAGASIAHCPKSNSKFGHGIAPLPAFVRLGAKTGVATDGSASNNAMDMFDEMRVGLYLQRGLHEEFPVLTERQMIGLTTIDAARAIGCDSFTGSLEEGKQADIIAVDISRVHNYPTYDPYSTLVYAANQDDVMFTMVAGKILYDAGQVLTVDEDEVRMEVDRVVTDLRKLL